MESTWRKKNVYERHDNTVSQQQKLWIRKWRKKVKVLFFDCKLLNRIFVRNWTEIQGFLLHFLIIITPCTILYDEIINQHCQSAPCALGNKVYTLYMQITEYKVAYCIWNPIVYCSQRWHPIFGSQKTSPLPRLLVFICSVRSIGPKVMEGERQGPMTASDLLVYHFLTAQYLGRSEEFETGHVEMKWAPEFGNLPSLKACPRVDLTQVSPQFFAVGPNMHGIHVSLYLMPSCASFLAVCQPAVCEARLDWFNQNLCTFNGAHLPELVVRGRSIFHFLTRIFVVR